MSQKPLEASFRPPHQFHNLYFKQFQFTVNKRWTYSLNAALCARKNDNQQCSDKEQQHVTQHLGDKKIQKFCAPILTPVRICRNGKKAERTTAFMQVEPGVILLGIIPFPAGTLILYS